jgi:hypothetical protein
MARECRQLLIGKMDGRAFVDSEPHRYCGPIRRERGVLVFEAQSVVDSLGAVQPMSITGNADRTAGLIGWIFVAAACQAKVGLARVDYLLDAFATSHIGEFVTEAVDEFSLCGIEPVGRLDEQRLDFRPTEPPLRKPSVGRREPRLLSSKLLIRSPNSMFCSVFELDVPIAGGVVVQPVTFVMYRLVVGLMVIVAIVRFVPGRMVVAGRMLGRFMIAVMIAARSIGVVACYTWLMATSGHAPWF